MENWLYSVTVILFLGIPPKEMSYTKEMSRKSYKYWWTKIWIITTVLIYNGKKKSTKVSNNKQMDF